MCRFPNKNCHFALAYNRQNVCELRLSDREKAQKRLFLLPEDEFPEKVNSLRQRKLLRGFSLRRKDVFFPVSGEIVHLRCHFIRTAYQKS
jgi:hypothetical protein